MISNIFNVCIKGFKHRNYIVYHEAGLTLETITDETPYEITNINQPMWDGSGILMVILDDKEPITLEMIRQKKIEVDDVERFKLLRELRDKLLAETDYLMNPDYPHKTEEKKQAWKDYRQALRDLPDNSNPKLNEKGELDMDSITLPLKPN